MTEPLNLVNRMVSKPAKSIFTEIGVLLLGQRGIRRYRVPDRMPQQARSVPNPYDEAGKFRAHLITVIQDTISDELAEEFEKNTEDYPK